jgi:hypothetical protein
MAGQTSAAAEGVWLVAADGACRCCSSMQLASSLQHLRVYMEYGQACTAADNSAVPVLQAVGCLLL